MLQINIYIYNIPITYITNDLSTNDNNLLNTTRIASFPEIRHGTVVVHTALIFDNNFTTLHDKSINHTNLCLIDIIQDWKRYDRRSAGTGPQ